MNTTRTHIIETTGNLLERQGYHATGLNEIVAESGAPKGSLYYYFPQGKEQIGEETLIWSGDRMAERIRTGLEGHAHPAEAVRALAFAIAEAIEASNFQAGGPLTTVALETATSIERLNLACRKAYEFMRLAFEEKFIVNGFPKSQSRDLAGFVLAAFEGSILLSRVHHSGDSLRKCGDQLAAYIRYQETIQ